MSRECIRLVEEASAGGDLERVKSIVLDNELAYSGKALEQASDGGHIAVVRFLLKVIRQDRIVIALELAVDKGHLEVVRLLCPYIKNGNTGSAVAIAAEQGRLDMIKVMDQLTDTMEMDQALRSACQFGHLPVVQYLIEEHEMTDMLLEGCGIACRYGHLAIAQFLYRPFANVDSLVLSAIEGESSEVIRWLFSLPSPYGADWRTILNRAAVLGRLEVVDQILSKHPVQVDQAIYFAAQHGHAAILDRLYLLNQEQAVHKVAFMVACRQGHIPILEFYHTRRQFDSVVINESLNKACLTTKHEVVRWLTAHYQIGPVSLQFEFGMAANRVELNPNGSLVLAALLDATIEVDPRSYVEGMDFQALLKVYYTVRLPQQRERLLEASTDLQGVVQAMEQALLPDIIKNRVAHFL